MPGPPQRPSPPHSSPKARRHAPTPPQARPDPIGFPSLASVGSSAPLRALIDPPRSRPAPPPTLYGTSPRFPHYFPLSYTSYSLPQSVPKAPFPIGPPTLVDPNTVTNPNYQWGTRVPTWIQAVQAEGVAISNARAAAEANVESIATEESRRLSRHQNGGAPSMPPPAT